MTHTPQSTTHWACDEMLKDKEVKYQCCGCMNHKCKKKEYPPHTSPIHWVCDEMLKNKEEYSYGVNCDCCSCVDYGCGIVYSTGI